METLRHIQTFGTFAYFHKFYRLFLLQNPFMKQVTFQGPILPSAEYFQQSAQVPSQRDLGSKVFFGIRFGFKDVSGFPLMFRKVNLCSKTFSPGSPADRSELLRSMLAPAASLSLAQLFPLTS